MKDAAQSALCLGRRRDSAGRKKTSKAEVRVARAVNYEPVVYANDEAGELRTFLDLSLPIPQILSMGPWERALPQCPVLPTWSRFACKCVTFLRESGAFRPATSLRPASYASATMALRPHAKIDTDYQMQIAVSRGHSVKR